MYAFKPWTRIVPDFNKYISLCEYFYYKVDSLKVLISENRHTDFVTSQIQHLLVQYFCLEPPCIEWGADY